MAYDSSFPFEVKYVELPNGSQYFMLGEQERSNILRAHEDAKKGVEKAQAKLSDLETGDDKEAIAKAKEILEKREEYLEYTTLGVDNMNDVCDQCEPIAKKYSFVLKRLGWDKNEQAKNEARLASQKSGIGEFDDMTYVLHILNNHIESWNIPDHPDEKISKGSICKVLPPHVIDSVYRAITAESEPNAARLPFHGISANGHGGGESG